MESTLKNSHLLMEKQIRENECGGNQTTFEKHLWRCLTTAWGRGSFGLCCSFWIGGNYIEFEWTRPFHGQPRSVRWSCKEGNQRSRKQLLLVHLVINVATHCQVLLSSAQDYRRLLSRPSKKTSMRILFHHQNAMYRAQFFMQLIFDLINANFDYVVDYLVIEAQLFHSSGFSLGFVLAVLLLSRIQRPYTNKTVHG